MCLNFKQFSDCWLALHHVDEKLRGNHMESSCLRFSVKQSSYTHLWERACITLIQRWKACLVSNIDFCPERLISKPGGTRVKAVPRAWRQLKSSLNLCIGFIVMRLVRQSKAQRYRTRRNTNNWPQECSWKAPCRRLISLHSCSAFLSRYTSAKGDTTALKKSATKGTACSRPWPESNMRKFKWRSRIVGICAAIQFCFNAWMAP